MSRIAMLAVGGGATDRYGYESEREWDKEGERKRGRSKSAGRSRAAGGQGGTRDGEEVGSG